MGFRRSVAMGEAPGQKDTFAFVDTNCMPAWQPAGAPKTQVTGADSQVLTIMPAGTSSGMAFINAGGTVLEKTLAEGEEVLIDHNSIVGFQETVKYDLVTVGNLLMCCAGGEGCFQAKMTGPGKVYMQSMSFEKFVNSLVGGGGK